MSSNTSNTESETQNYNRNLLPLDYLKLYHEERMNQMDRNFVDMHKLENAIFLCYGKTMIAIMMRITALL